MCVDRGAFRGQISCGFPLDEFTSLLHEDQGYGQQQKSVNFSALIVSSMKWGSQWYPLYNGYGYGS